MAKQKADFTDQLLEQIFNEKDNPIDLVSLFEEKLTTYDLSKRKVLNLLSLDQRTLDDILQGTAKQPSIINILKIADFLDMTDLTSVHAAVLRNREKKAWGPLKKQRMQLFVAKHFDIKIILDRFF